MLLARGRFWNARLTKAGEQVAFTIHKELLPEHLQELSALKIELPLENWNRVVKHARTDRKLLGGIMLDYTKQKDQLSAAMGSDRLYGELQRVVIDATSSLVEAGTLTLTVVDVGAD